MSLLEWPGALLSFALNRAAAWAFSVAVRGRTGVDETRAPAWVPFDRHTVRAAPVLHYMALRGPRWNPHALLASTPGFRVRGALAVDVDGVAGAAESMSLLVYRHNKVDVAAEVTPDLPRDEQGYAVVQLPPGEYRMTARYYRWSDRPRLPAVRVDGRDSTPPRDLVPADHQWPRDLPARETWFHRWTQRYVLTLLRHASRFAPETVEREYLPVGNPGTTYRYGLLEPGASLRITVAPSLLDRALVMLTRYDAASFPIWFDDLGAGQTVLPPRDGAGHWLLRLHPREPGAFEVDDSEIAIQLDSPAR